MPFAVSLSILSHSLRTLRHLPDEKEQLQGATAHCSPCCRGCFTHTGNPSKSSLGPAVEGKATLWRGDSVFAKEHSAFVPEQTRAYKTHFGFSDCQLKICRFSRCPDTIAKTQTIHRLVAWLRVSCRSGAAQRHPSGEPMSHSQSIYLEQ